MTNKLLERKRKMQRHREKFPHLRFIWDLSVSELDTLDREYVRRTKDEGVFKPR